MRIGIDARFAVHERRGIGTYVLNLITNLAALDDVNQYVLYVDQKDKDGVLPHRNNFHVKLLRPANYLLWEQIALPRAVLRDSIDILHCTGVTAPLFLNNRAKLIMTIHDVLYLKSYSQVPKSLVLRQRMGRLYRKFIVPRSVKHASIVITISNYSASDIETHIPTLHENKIVVDYLAASEIFGKHDDINMDGIRNKYNIHDEYILAVGGTDPRKNLEFIVVNYLKLRDAGIIKEKLVIVGVHNWKQSQFNRFANEAEDSGDILFTKFVSEKELAALYQGAKAVLYLSLYEGFGIPPLEAMTCGTPVITSNTTSLPEIVGDAALMIDPTDEKAFEVALIGLLNDEKLRQELIKRGLERVKRFSWKKTAEETLKIYESVMR